MKSFTAILIILLLCQNGQSQTNPVTFDLLLTYTANSPLTAQRDEAKFLAMYGKAGMSQEDVQNHGMDATEFFLEKYGVDFTDIPPENLTHVRETRDGVTFMSYINEWTQPGPYRLVSAINHTDSALFTNAPIGDLGWMVVFLREYNSTGNLSMTIPSQGAGLFGDYVVDVLLDDREQTNPFFPPNVLDNEVLRISYQTPQVQFPPANVPEGRTRLYIVDFEVSHRVYGSGAAQGIYNPGTGNIRNVLRFPDEGM